MIPPHLVPRYVGGRILATLLLLALTACGHTAPTRYLTLAAVPPGTPVALAGAGDTDAGVSVTLRPPRVRWPAALDRLEVLRPAGDVRLAADELARWSAAPGELAAAALTEDLQARLPGLALAGPEGGPAVLDLAVEVVSLSRTADGYRLTAVATLSGGPSGARSSFLSVSTAEPAPGAEAEARAVSQLIGRLADRLAPQLAALSPAASGPSASRRPTP